MQSDLVLLTEVKILSKPEPHGYKVSFQVSDGDGVSTIYISEYRRNTLISQVNKLQRKLVDIEVQRVPWFTRSKSGTMFYLMDIKES